MRNIIKSLYFLFIILIILCSYSFAQNTFIRTNQVGFLPYESKTAILFSEEQIDDEIYSIYNYYTEEIIYAGKLNSSIGSYGKYSNCYTIDFSSLNTNGKYYIEFQAEQSYPFSISPYLYTDIVDSLSAFFKIQRCGFNMPMLHDFCHYYDATNIIYNDLDLGMRKDLTGGWHDAGDYTKFLNTIAYATYTMLFSYEFDETKFNYDLNNNNFPDILEEAKIGIDWLIKANYNNTLLVTQIQNLRDQNQGWRLPENDNLTNDRPGYLGIGKNLIGIYSATTALAHRIYSKYPEHEELANQCLTLAENFFSLRNEVQDLSNSETGHYQDSKFSGKLALGAIELYISTNNLNYLNEAKIYAKDAGSDFWWSWGDINSYSHYRIAKIDSDYADYILSNLLYFKKLSDDNIFSVAVSDTWGTNSANLGVALQAILWQDLTGDSTFADLAISQRDYILGKNPWGISFIYNIGSESTKHFHSQVAYFNNGKLTGAVSAGPISRSKLNQYNIEYETLDKYDAFQTEESVYKDDRMDYITNEPTITANATALFVFGYYSKR